MAFPVPPDALVELTALRDRNRKVYQHVDGDARHRLAIIAGGVHFRHRDTLAWADADELVQDVGGTKETLGADVTWRFGAAGLELVRGQVHVTMRPTRIAMVDTTSRTYRLIANANIGQAMALDARTFRWQNVFPNVDLELVFGEWALKERFVVKARPNLPDPVSLGMNPDTTWLVVAFDVSGLPRVPEDAVTGAPFDVNSVTFGDLVIRNAGGDVVFAFPGGESRSANGVRRPVAHLRTANVDFGVAVSYNTVERTSYPLVIDPTTSVYVGASLDDGVIARNLNNGVKGTNTDMITMLCGWWTDTGDPKNPVPYESRNYWRFNLASLSGATCNSASLKSYVQYLVGGNTFHLILKLCTADWNPLDNTDWDAAGTDESFLASVTESAYNSWAITAADLEAKFGGEAAFEMRDTAGLYAIQVYTYDNGSNQPYLYIDYSEGGGGTAYYRDADGSEPTATGTLARLKAALRADAGQEPASVGILARRTGFAGNKSVVTLSRTSAPITVEITKTVDVAGAANARLGWCISDD